MSHRCRLRKCRSPGGPVPLWRCGECEGLPPEHSHNKDNKNLIKCHHQVSTFTFLLSDPSLLSWYQSIKATIHLDMSIQRTVSCGFSISQKVYLTSEVDGFPGIFRLIQHRVLDLGWTTGLDYNSLRVISISDNNMTTARESLIQISPLTHYHLFLHSLLVIHFFSPTFFISSWRKQAKTKLNLLIFYCKELFVEQHKKFGSL